MTEDFDQIQTAFAEAGMHEISSEALAKFDAYLSLLQRWNARLNLSSIREPRQIIKRHFVESAFVARHLPLGITTLLDYGSGAGFPGIPIAICRPEIRVTLGEAQSRKASFLREAARVTDTGCEIFDKRVESMPSSHSFDAVTMRAVEKMEAAIPVAAAHAGKCLAILTTEDSSARFTGLAPEFRWENSIKLDNFEQIVILLGVRV